MNHALGFLFQIHRRWLRWRRALTLGVRLIVLHEESEVLLVRHTYLRGWYLPGGGVDHGETFEAAARRELVEECGLHAGSLQLHGVFINQKGQHVDHIATFLVRDWTGRPSPQDLREIAEVRFFKFSDLPPDLVSGHRSRILEFQGEQSLSARW